jgi:hypothetical protein
MVPLPEFIGNTPGPRFPVVEEAVVMETDHIIMVVDRQMAKEQKKDFIIGINIIAIQLLAE